MPIAQALFGCYDTEDDPKLASQAFAQQAPPENLASSKTSNEHPKHNGQAQDTLKQVQNGRKSSSETRQELIERIKQEQRVVRLHELQVSRAKEYGLEDGGRPSQQEPEFSTGTQGSDSSGQEYDQAMDIVRPRSAFHRGDFREEGPGHLSGQLQPGSSRPASIFHDQSWLSTSPPRSWASARYVPPSLPRQTTYTGPESVITPNPRPLRPRAVSHSLQAPSFALLPPTSPLVNEARNSDNERSELNFRKRSRSPDKSSRRRTFSPGYLEAAKQRSFNDSLGLTRARALPNIRREGSFPYQAHQPRRSLNSFSEVSPVSVAQATSARSRRLSQLSDASPLQRAPMVGGYEESIIRGRMSTLPSRPLDFVARIGVLGKGECRPSLKCPPHITVPFPAVFYSYGSRPGSPTSTVNEPSPYVGMVDLEAPRENVPSSHSPVKVGDPWDKTNSPDLSLVRSSNGFGAGVQALQQDPPRTRKTTRNVPPGGYRIPQAGQLQIIIKNPNKTAVKLFLVPYDLHGMVPGQKTFIRQRSYSAGPLIDMPIMARTNLGTDRPEAAISNSDDPKDRPVLRYLIHLNICCPSRGRFYLYRSIRVVFANRVPDGKEKLRQEIQMPDPRFSRYKLDLETPNKTLNLATHSRDMSDGKHGAHIFAHSKHDTPSVGEQHGYAQEDSPTGNRVRSRSFPLPSLPDTTFATDANQGLHDADSGMRDPDSPISVPSANCTFIQEFTDLSSRVSASSEPRPASRSSVARLFRDEFAKDSSFRARTRSPQPGQGLLSLQVRDQA